MQIYVLLLRIQCIQQSAEHIVSCYVTTIVEIFHVLIFVMMHEGEECIFFWCAVAYAV